jgi:hypothetical protein
MFEKLNVFDRHLISKFDESLHRVVVVSPSNIMITRLRRNIQKKYQKFEFLFLSTAIW